MHCTCNTKLYTLKLLVIKETIRILYIKWYICPLKKSTVGVDLVDRNSLRTPKSQLAVARCVALGPMSLNQYCKVCAQKIFQANLTHHTIWPFNLTKRNIKFQLYIIQTFQLVIRVNRNDRHSCQSNYLNHIVYTLNIKNNIMLPSCKKCGEDYIKYWEWCKQII